MALLPFLCFLFLIIVSQAKAGDPVSCDNSRGNYTSNSTYDNNLKTLISRFTSNKDINYGFYNFSYGQDPDKVYVIGMCWGDLEPNECLTNISNSFADLKEQCPNQKEAIVWGVKLTLWYSNRSISGIVATDPTMYLVYNRGVNDVDKYRQALSNLMVKLKDNAASGDSRRKYDADNVYEPVNFATIYGVVQCLPDLSGQECNDCLDRAISEIPNCCTGKMGGHVLKPSCRLRFDPYRFYNPTIELDSVATPPSQSTTNTSSGHNKTRTAIAIAVPLVIVVLVFILVCFCLRKPKHSFEANNEEYDDEDEDEMMIADSLQFNFDTILVAIDHFSNSNKIGHGGFGVVYRGKLSNGQIIAVKRLSTDSTQGDLEFKNEVMLEDSNFLFLGIPIGCNPRRESTWKPLLLKVRRRLEGWSNRFLNLGGRITLLKSVLSSLCIFMMSFYRMPKKVEHEFISVFRKFLWSGVEDKRHISWIKWEVVTLPLSKGGLGIKNLELFNLSLLNKWRWRILQGKNSLWLDILRSRYGDISLRLLAPLIRIIPLLMMFTIKEMLLLNNILLGLTKMGL